jgi:hypothetical protein
MTPTELKLVENEIRSVYREWHCCGLRAKDMSAEDRARGLKVGQMCDSCEDMIKSRMAGFTKLVKRASKEPPKKTSDTSYDEFCKWAIQELMDAVIVGGFKEYRVVQTLYTIFREGGFKPND